MMCRVLQTALKFRNLYSKVEWFFAERKDSLCSLHVSRREIKK